MSNAGLFFTGEIYADGKLHRFKADGDHDKNAWYVFHPGPLAAGAFGCWKRGFKETGANAMTICRRQTCNAFLGVGDKPNGKTRRKQQRGKEGAANCGLGYSRARRPVTSHSYLKARQVHSYGELKQYGDALVLPLRDAERRPYSLQFIGVNVEVKNFCAEGTLQAVSLHWLTNEAGRL